MKKISNMEMENISGGVIWQLTDSQVGKLVRKGYFVTARRGFDRNGHLMEGFSVLRSFMQRVPVDRNAIYRLLRLRPEILLEDQDIQIIRNGLRGN